MIILGNEFDIEATGVHQLWLRPPASADDSPLLIMLEFLVAQNWEERKPRGPRALRSSRAGIAKGRCREGGMWRFLKPMIEPWKGAGRIICFLPAASGGAVPCLVLGESCKLHRICTKRRSFARLVGIFFSSGMCGLCPQADQPRACPSKGANCTLNICTFLESCTKSAQMPFLVPEIYQDQP